MGGGRTGGGRGSTGSRDGSTGCKSDVPHEMVGLALFQEKLVSLFQKRFQLSCRPAPELLLTPKLSEQHPVTVRREHFGHLPVPLLIPGCLC